MRLKEKMKRRMKKKVVKNIIKWASTSKLLKFPRRIIKECVCYGISIKKGYLLFYNDPETARILDIVRKIKDENNMALRDNEAYQVYMAVRATQKIEGDIVEVGVFKGGSAKLINEIKGNKFLHLFDTFEGLPDLSEEDNKEMCRKGLFKCSLEDVKEYLKECTNIEFYKGIFPSTSDPIKNTKFSFVHLDVDLYEGTLKSLKFLYPRVNKGGIIISHDYSNSHTPGVKKAFDDFFKDKKEPIVEMSGTQCLIVKLGRGTNDTVHAVSEPGVKE